MKAWKWDSTDIKISPHIWYNLVICGGHLTLYNKQLLDYIDYKPVPVIWIIRIFRVTTLDFKIE